MTAPCRTHARRLSCLSGRSCPSPMSRLSGLTSLLPTLLLPALLLTAAPLRADPAPPVAETAQRLADGSLFVPKPVQRLLGIRTGQGERGEFARVLTLSGRVIADPNAGGRIQASEAGIISGGPRGIAVVGQKVKAGEVLAYLKPALDAASRADKEAAAADLAAQVSVQEKRLARLQQLEGSVPRKEIEQAAIELDSLRARRSAQSAAASGRIALTAPVAGVVAASRVSLGQVVETRDILFEIIDPRHLAVEAQLFDSSLAGSLGAASARQGDADPAPLRLSLIGAGRSLREQALPVLYRIRSEGGELPSVAVGQSLSVLAETTRRQAGIAVPADSLSRGSHNETLLWVHVGPEQFQPRQVRSQPLDAARVLVTEGLNGDERIVVRGADALSQVR